MNYINKLIPPGIERKPPLQQQFPVETLSRVLHHEMSPQGPHLPEDGDRLGPFKCPRQMTVVVGGISIKYTRGVKSILAFYEARTVEK